METLTNTTTVKKDSAESYYLSSHNHSWTIFMITDKGDLFINGDWGYYCYAWRAFGGNFKEFLLSITPDYLIAKLEANASIHKKTKITGRQKEALLFFMKELQKQLKQEIELQKQISG